VGPDQPRALGLARAAPQLSLEATPHSLDPLAVREDPWLPAGWAARDPVLPAVDDRSAGVLGNFELLAQGVLVIGLIDTNCDNMQRPYAALHTGLFDAIIKSFV
jgi:hypothetical protein